MGYKKIIGIYKIENMKNGNIYIGQSNSIYNRWANHKSLLKRNAHDNTYLQRSWNKYGEDAFDFTILYECEENELDDLEIQYISKYDSFKNGYNLTEGGNSRRGFKISELQKQKLREFHTGRKASEETKLKMSMSRIGKCYVGKGGDNHSAKRVVCLNTGIVYDSIVDASIKTEASSIVKCCKGRTKHSGVDESGLYLVWRYYDDYMQIEDCSIVVEEVNRNRKFINIDDMTIITYSELKELGVSIESMRNACSGITKSILIANKNKRVMYYYDYIINGDTTCGLVGKDAVIDANNVMVRCVTTNEVFESMKDAGAKYSIKATQKIGMVCRGERQTCGEFEGVKLKWEYYSMGLDENGNPIVEVPQA